MSNQLKNEKLQDLLKKVNSTADFSGVELKEVNQRGFFGTTPLHVAVIWEDLEAVRILLESGAEPNAKAELNYTPLHDAVDFENLEITKLLLEFGASKETKNTEGNTPLQIAELNKNDQLIALLKS